MIMTDEMIKHLQKQLVGLVGQRYGGSNVEGLLEFLHSYGLLDYRHCRALQTCLMVKKLVDEGKYVSEALHIVADNLSCSYECARKNYYAYLDQWVRMSTALQLQPQSLNQPT